MPTFETPQPILATIEVTAGDLRITAQDRSDTVVEVRPSDPSHEPDVQAAEQTRVEMTPDGLLVKGPKQRGLPRSLVGTPLFGKPGSVDVTITLPAGSRLRSDTGIATLRCSGRLAACRAKTGAGDIDLENTGPAELTTGAGGISVGVVDGSADIKTGTGSVRVTQIDGPAVVRNANGETWIGAVTGNLQVTSSNGSVSIDQAGADVNARTANGPLSIGSVSRGVTTLKTSLGAIEVGIAAGTAALVDAHTRFGNVRNGLAAADSPQPSDEKAEVHAQTGYGDITIRRA
jgi:DUF4097 and DUF4098 domain-containing protein YvlB